MGAVLGYEPNVTGSNGYEETAGSSVVVITAGLPRSPGMSRDDLVSTNEKIVTDVTEKVTAQSPDAILIVVSNPLDAMCHVAKNVSGWPKQRVFGMAGILDTARFSTFIAWETGSSVKDVQAMVLGGHGDQMVPVVSATTVGGVPLRKLVAEEKIQAMVARTAKGGGELVNLMGTSAWYAPGAAAAQMVDSIMLDEKRVLPCTAYLEGEYGIDGLYMGVPVKLGPKGIEQIVELDLTDAEQERAAGLLRGRPRGRRRSSRPPSSYPVSAGVAATLAEPALSPLAKSDGGDEKGGGGVGPPPPDQRIEQEAGEQPERQVGADHALGAFLHGRGGVELLPDAALEPGEERHRRRGDGGEPDADPARSRLVAGGERASGLDCDIRGEDEEARGDQLLGASFGLVGADAPAGEEPDDDQPGERFDQAVGAEADQRDRAGGDAGEDGDRELDGVPGDAAPGEPSRRALESRALTRREPRRRADRQRPLGRRRRQLDHAAHPRRPAPIR